MRAASFRGIALCAVALVATASAPAAAQTIAVPDFTVATPTLGDHIQDVDVAVGTDGTVTFIWGEYTGGGVSGNMAATRQFTAGGAPVGPVRRVDTTKHVFGPRISSDTRGGYVAAWQWIQSGQEYAYFGQFLDATGAPTGDDFRIDFDDSGVAIPGGVAGLPSGSVFTWLQLGKLWGQRFDTAGQKAGDAFVIGTGASGFDYDAAATPSGGFVATWKSTWEAPFSKARVYDADGQPLGPAFAIGPGDFQADRVAASPLGGFVASGYRFNSALNNTEVWLVRFSEDGQTLGSHRVEIPAEGVSIKSDVAIDAQGKIYTFWREYQIPGDGARRPRARAFDPAGNPVIFGFWPSLATADEVATAVLPNGHFVNFWYRNSVATADVVDIPPPAGVVCGDGVLTPGFEECDDGAANSDTAPDACRTNCLLPRCGDTVTDGAEACDDGNATSCDGCSAGCVVELGPVCGDGVVEPSCGEACDDGNGALGDGCTYACEVEPCMACTGSPSVCAPLAPAGDCHEPLVARKSQLLLKNHPVGSDGDKLAWKWSRGDAVTAAELGDPLGTTGYTLCVYDGASLVLGLRAPAGGSCDGKPCWKATGSAPKAGFKYRDADRTPDGLQSLLVKAGPEGGPKVIVKGKGGRLRLPSLPLAQSPTVRVQLLNDIGTCWSDTYGAPAKANDGRQFMDSRSRNHGHP